MSGYLDAAIYVFLSAIAFVFLDELCTNISPFTALFVMSGIALAFFNLFSIHKLKNTYKACYNNKTIFILMSTALSIDWVCMVYATHLSDPFVAMSSLFITLAFGGFIKQYLQSRDLVNLLSAGLLLFSILTLFFFYKVGVSRYVLYGILLGATAGIAFFLYIIFSDMLTKRAQLDTMQLMATRFWILFLGSSLFLSKIDLYQAILISGIPLILVSFGACIVPNFFNQQAIKKLGPIRSSILISFVPPIAYIFDACYNEKLNLLNLIVCLIITSALILHKLLIPLQKAKVPMESNL